MQDYICIDFTFGSLPQFLFGSTSHGIASSAFLFFGRPGALLINSTGSFSGLTSLIGATALTSPVASFNKKF
ncbi:hypothetical protein BpHYR1_051851 [Brachionus plicatilis]|uniref:Uncharacterized protein n=1 Tax=Brachionus plicatilis TaxID=10195 RepID=A0A3M7SI09_BRAPC|nr:hypothetical protein BpHYR1_051851 [Brachionus plicatilis]